MREVTQNPDRYSVNPQRTEWRISASPSIPPLVFTFGSPLPNLKGVLEVDGIIVRVGDWHLVSPKTLSDIQSSLNPHYDSVQNGTVGGKPMGNTVPIITLDLTPLKTIGDSREVSNRIGGVVDVQYPYEDDTLIDEIPQSLLQQINWTLTSSDIKSEDTYTYYNFYDMVDEPHYSIQKLNNVTAQSDGRLDKSKLNLFLSEIDTRLQLLRRDFNTIKDVFFEGKEVGIQTVTQSEIASVFDSDENLLNGKTRVRKESRMVDIVSTPQTDALTNG